MNVILIEITAGYNYYAPKRCSLAIYRYHSIIIGRLLDVQNMLLTCNTGIACRIKLKNCVPLDSCYGANLKREEKRKSVYQGNYFVYAGIFLKVTKNDLLYLIYTSHLLGIFSLLLSFLLFYANINPLIGYTMISMSISSICAGCIVGMFIKPM